MKRLAPLLILLAACASAPPELQRLARHNSHRPLAWLRLTGAYDHALFCAKVESLGYFEHPVPQGLDPAQSDAHRVAASKNPPAALGYVPQMSDESTLLIGVDAALSLSPGPPGAVEGNPDYIPSAPGAVNCFCWSEARRELMAMCPENPGEQSDCAAAAEIESHCDQDGHELRIYDIHILPPFSPGRAAACDRARATLRLCAGEP